jgi:hypothetical protein
LAGGACRAALPQAVGLKVREDPPRMGSLRTSEVQTAEGASERACMTSWPVLMDAPLAGSFRPALVNDWLPEGPSETRMALAASSEKIRKGHYSRSN